MRTNQHITATLGDLIVAIYDEAARYSTDSGEVSRLAAQAVNNILRQTGRPSSILMPRPALVDSAGERRIAQH